ncbi:inositol monophosphatase [Candidatus Pelagibacter sp.]|nr:inositol monophosphatase [Candidatus Pelagibacter sp.]
MNSISPNLNIMIKACEKASKVIIRDFGEVENLQVAKKGPRDFVTKTDKRVEEILIEELSRAKKNYSFLTEESGIIEKNDKDKIWIIDPIDGTTNFLHGIPHFAISIALKIDNELKSALIHDPIKNEIFFAEVNNGAYYNNHRIRVSNKTDIEDCLFSSDQYGVKVIFPSLNMRSSGCAALDLAYVGSGRLDGFFHNKINLWDIAAGILIVKEAGGSTNDFSKFEYDSIDIRAASSSIYSKMMKKLNNF